MSRKSKNFRIGVREGGDEYTWMPLRIEREWAIFLDERGRKKYDPFCRMRKGGIGGAFVSQQFYAHTILEKERDK